MIKEEIIEKLINDRAFAEYLTKANLSEYDMVKLVCHAPISLAKRENIRVIEKEYNDREIT